MLNRDYPFVIADLEKRTEAIEKVISLKTEKDINNEDWDNSQLMKKWQISQRTTANYRKQGLEHYKVGGRIYYTPEQRKKFIAKSKTEKLNINEQVEEDKKSMSEKVSYNENFADKGQTVISMEVIDAIENGKNEDSTIYSIKTVTPMVRFSIAKTTIELEDLYHTVVDFTQNVDTYQPGNRNNFIYKLSNNLNRAGIEKDTAENLLLVNYTERDIQNEIPKALESAYSHTGEYGKFDFKYFDSVCSARTASFASTAKRAETPIIPEEVYNRLPEFLNECTSAFRIERERDMFLTGALSNLSGCFNNVEGKYDRRLYSPNLYSFTIAPPASGKGVVNFSRQLPSVLHKELNNSAEVNSLDYGDKNVQPKGIFIPADSSSAAIKRMLVANNEQGIISETEADTLSTTLAQDWGGFDDLLRKAFQHEPVTFSRVDKDSDDVKLREINRPKLSVCLTGTPNQAPALLKSTENGLFSRFMFYNFKNDNSPEFKNVFADDEELSLEEFFAEKAEIVHEMYKKANSVEKCRFSLSKANHEEFLKKFNKMLNEMLLEYGEETQGIVFRLGLITFRIAMLLTIIRTLENNTFSESIECCDDDFKTSIELSDIYIQHSMSVYKSLPGKKQIKQNAMNLLNYLPNEFSYSQAEIIGGVFCDIKSRSISNYLDELLSHKLLEQPKRNGSYYKS